MRRQDAWGWEVAADILLGGAGAGIYVASFLLGTANLLNPDAQRWGLLLGPVLLIAGLAILFAELGRPARMIRVFANIRSSWMSAGGLIQAAFVLCSLGYSLPMFAPFAWLPWEPEGVGLAMGVAGLVAGALVLLYHGFLFGSARGIPLWNTPALQPLLLSASLSAGFAVLLLLGQVLGVGLREFRVVEGIALVLLVAEGVTLWAFLTTPAGRSFELSTAELKTPANLAITGGVGIVLPAILLAAILSTGLHVLAILVGLLILAGGFYLRNAFIKAGRYYPARIAVSR